MNSFPKLLWLGLSLILSACSVLESDKIDYKSAVKATALEVPPDLTQLARETRYLVPGATVTASSQTVNQSGLAQTTAAAVLGDVRIVMFKLWGS